MAATASRLRATERLSSRTLEWWIAAVAPPAAAAIAFIWILDSQLLRLYSVSAPSWDLGQTQQLLWSLANGYGWTSSFEYGHNFVGIHLEPILLIIAGVERLWPSPVVPLVFSAAGIAAMAPAAFLMFRAFLPKVPGAGWLALALSVPMPFWAATQQTAAEQFHPENMALAFAMLAVWAGLRAKPRLLWVLVILVLSCKEDQTYTAFLIGLVVWRGGPAAMRAHGRAVMVFSAVWLVLGVGLLEGLVRKAGYSPDVAYYWWIWSPNDRNFLLINIARPDAWLVLAGLILSLGGLPLLAPRWLLFVVPPLLASLLSSHEAQGELHLHYVLILMFPLIVAGAFGARRLLAMPAIRNRVAPAAFLAAALPALVLGLVFGQVPPALGADAWLYTRPPATDRLLAAAKVIPADAAVYADDGAAVWLADRRQILVLPSQLPTDAYIVVDRQDWAHRKQAGVARADEIALLEASGRRLLVDDGRFQVWSPPGS